MVTTRDTKGRFIKTAVQEEIMTNVVTSSAPPAVAARATFKPIGENRYFCDGCADAFDSSETPTVCTNGHVGNVVKVKAKRGATTPVEKRSKRHFPVSRGFSHHKLGDVVWARYKKEIYTATIVSTKEGPKVLIADMELTDVFSKRNWQLGRRSIGKGILANGLSIARAHITGLCGAIDSFWKEGVPPSTD
jgi:hypothetical protein